MTFTSLSTITGTSKDLPKYSETTKSSQPGIIGGRTTVPVENSTGPGTPMPTARTSLGDLPDRDRTSAKCCRTSSNTVTGPAAISTALSRITVGIASEVSGCNMTVGGSQIGAEDHARFGVERQQDRSAPSGGWPIARLHNQPGLQNLVDQNRHGRSGQACQAGELCSAYLASLGHETDEKPMLISCAGG